MSLPVVGREYDYLDTTVEVIEVIPCKGASDDESMVRVRSRFGDVSYCEAGELAERKPPKQRAKT